MPERLLRGIPANSCLHVDMLSTHIMLHTCTRVHVCNFSPTKPPYPRPLSSGSNCSNQHRLSQTQGLSSKAEVARDLGQPRPCRGHTKRPR